MIIDISNAPCGPGFLPGLRLSEGRYAINRRKKEKRGRARPRLCFSSIRGWGRRRRPPPSSPQVQTSPGSGARRPPRPRERAPPRAGCRWITLVFPPVLTTRARGRSPPAIGRVTRAPSRRAKTAAARRPAETRCRATAKGAEASPSPPALELPPPPPPSTLTSTSDQARQPAEFKHITKRRKRN